MKPPHFKNTLSHHPCRFLKQFWNLSFVSVCMRCNKKYSEHYCWVPSHGKAGLQKHHGVSSSTLLTESGAMGLPALSQSQNDHDPWGSHDSATRDTCMAVISLLFFFR